jgi:hypothetical protein
MTIFDEISIIANQLANKGKRPSVALVKAQLTQPVPLPQIISTLKGWQHDPSFINATHSTQVSESKKASTIKNEEIIQMIAEALQPVQQELAEVKALLAQLINNKTDN